MTRRGLLTGIFTAAPVATGAALVLAKPSATFANDGVQWNYFEADFIRAIASVQGSYKQWTINFSGWLRETQSDRIHCFWTALNRDRRQPCFFACYPGFEGRYITGDTFNVFCQEHQTWLFLGSSPEDRQTSFFDSYHRLMALFRAVDTPPTSSLESESPAP